MSILNDAEVYHDSNHQADDRSIEKHGQPAYSLFLTKKLISVHAELNITNSEDEVVYTSLSKALSFHDATSITDKNNHEIAQMEKKVFSIHAKHMITMDDGTCFELSSELLHITKEVINIEELGWQLRGNFANLAYRLLDGNGNVIAIFGHKMISSHDRYSVDIYKPEYEKIIVAILVTVEHMVLDQENARSAGSGTSSGSFTIHPSIR